jgi:ParB/RepB/Spo0J family partition protein
MSETVELLLSLKAIEPNPFNPRKHFSEAEIVELAASIKEQGLLQPILVRPLVKKHRGITHQLVLGERRWRALLWLGLEETAARVRAMTDYESSQAALSENIQRQDLTDYEEAEGLLQVVRQAEKEGVKLGVRELVLMFGKSETYIRSRLNLFNLKSDVQEMTQRHRMVLTSAYKINEVPDGEARRELIELVDAGASYKTIEAQVQQRKDDAAWQRESRQAPDNATRTVLKQQEQRGSEALRQVEAALAEAERQLINAEVWLEGVPAKARKGEVAAAIERIGKRVGALMPQG